MQGWIIVERLENWEVDAANKFAFFGLKDRYRKTAEQISTGDLLFCYVSSGRSAFADIRSVRESGLRPLKSQPYDLAYNHCFATAPSLVLPKLKWLPIKEVESELDLTRGRNDFRPLFQTSIRKITEHDTNLLERKLRAQAEK